MKLQLRSLPTQKASKQASKSTSHMFAFIRSFVLIGWKQEDNIPSSETINKQTMRELAKLIAQDSGTTSSATAANITAQILAGISGIFS